MTKPITLLALDIDGVLTDGRMLFTADGKEQKFISFQDIDAVFEARRRGFQVALVTGEDTPWVKSLSNRLQADYTIRGAKDKLNALQTLAKQLEIPMTMICYIGDSDRDAPALAAVGLGIVPDNATPQAKAAAHLILKSSGGDGALREALAYIMEIRGDSKKDLQNRRRAESLYPKPDHVEPIQQIEQIVNQSITVQQTIASQLAPFIAQAACEIIHAIEKGHKLLIFGNGGSAADAQHFAAELVGRFEVERKPIEAIALTTDNSILTAISNDYGIRSVFSRQIEAIGKPGDVAVAISTSGNSPNVLDGVRTSRASGLYTIGMSGKSGGNLAGLVDLCLCVPSETTARIQESHGLIIHLLCSLIETSLFRG